MADIAVFRDELRSLDGDLFLCHLFTPEQMRTDMLTLYSIYADSARIASIVSEPMLGAIRYQWWREIIDGKHVDTAPVSGFLETSSLSRNLLHDMINAREALFDNENPTLSDIEQAAKVIGEVFMKAAINVLDGEDAQEDNLLNVAGSGFELLRLSSTYPADMQDNLIASAQEKLQTARALFNALPRKRRKAILPAFLVIGLTRIHVQNIDKAKSLFFYQLHLLKMAFLGKL
ncbi:hypothetical protein IMCC14465_01340 [alpha proteobacterium IMCC14465]|uniref:Phytoene synthase n=1 Tax=alpha proteobacterium IMCC14465 TaxID=1220535 RepID=J9A5T8_9PROT|nr:hypothetical protein IMCC14465_01340 [alpha proteobacterium IMCC14465]